jgi:hypothetical protein
MSFRSLGDAINDITTLNTKTKENIHFYFFKRTIISKITKVLLKIYKIK